LQLLYFYYIDLLLFTENILGTLYCSHCWNGTLELHDVQNAFVLNNNFSSNAAYNGGALFLKYEELRIANYSKSN
jgi:hypothetical protein